MSWLRKLGMRVDELTQPSQTKLETVDEDKATQSSNGAVNTSKPSKRTKHPKEAPFISEGDYGKLKFRFENPDHQFITESGEPMVLHDLYTHAIIFGESGSGKTSFILNQFYEELFRSTHLKDGPSRDKKKFGGLVVEAKGDFAPKTWDLAVKYGRCDDVIFFGPTHLDNVYDPFGDASESPQQLADKMQAVMDSFSGGQKAQDPFWPAASRKLFTQIFHLHHKLRDYGSKELKPMSFDLLNLLLMDRGIPRNQGEIDSKARQFQETYDRFNAALNKIKAIATRISIEAGTFLEKAEIALKIAQEEVQMIDREIEEMSTPNPEWKRSVLDRKSKALRKLSVANNIKAIITCEDLGASSDKLIPRMEKFKKDVTGMMNAADDMARGRCYDSILDNGEDLRKILNPRLGMVAEAVNVDSRENLQLFRDMLMDLVDSIEKTNDIGEQLIAWKNPEPQTGMLKKMLTEYEQFVQQAGGDPAIDPVAAYFNEEYLNVANDKTSGSVAMTASNLVNLFVHAPFNLIFAPNATFDVYKIIESGKMVVLDLPQAKYGVVFNIASLIMKVDFFRAVLSRKVIRINDPVTGQMRQINQDRPLSYFCDEFASIVTTGDTTGEAGFLDKCREFKCACVLAVQSKPMLLKKIQEQEVNAILTNCGIKIFMRNTDELTTTLASKVLGSEIKVNANSHMGATEEAFKMDKVFGQRSFSTSYQRQPKYDPSKFASLKNGEAIVRLNPRFGAKQFKQVAFSLHVLDSIDKENLLPFPMVTTPPAKKEDDEA